MKDQVNFERAEAPGDFLGQSGKEDNAVRAETPEEAVVRLLKERGLFLTTAESCTGGMVASRIVNVPGASDVFHAGFITYCDKAKRKMLGVSKKTLKKYTAVSAATAAEMAEGAAKRAKADIAVSVTGIAGPDGGTEKFPVGLVFLGCSMSGKTEVEELHLNGGRAEIRAQAAELALDLVRKTILRGE